MTLATLRAALLAAGLACPSADAPSSGPVALVHGALPEALLREVEEAAPEGRRLELVLGSPAPLERPGWERIALDPGRGRLSLSHADARRVASARAIVLRGGTWMGWWGALTPSLEGPALRSLRAAHRGGAWILACDAAAGMLAGAARVDHAEWQELPRGRPPQRNPRQPADGPMTLGGLAFAGDALWARTLGEALEVLLAGEVERALVPEGSVAWIMTGDGRARVVGGGDEAHVLRLDARGARRVGTALHRVHMEDLRAGAIERKQRPSRVLELTPGDLFTTAPRASWSVTVRP